MVCPKKKFGTAAANIRSRARVYNHHEIYKNYYGNQKQQQLVLTKCFFYVYILHILFFRSNFRCLLGFLIIFFDQFEMKGKEKKKGFCGLDIFHSFIHSPLSNEFWPNESKRKWNETKNLFQFYFGFFLSFRFALAFCILLLSGCCCCCCCRMDIISTGNM